MLLQFLPFQKPSNLLLQCAEEKTKKHEIINDAEEGDVVRDEVDRAEDIDQKCCGKADRLPGNCPVSAIDHGAEHPEETADHGCGRLLR